MIGTTCLLVLGLSCVVRAETNYRDNKNRVSILNTTGAVIWFYLALTTIPVYSLFP